MTPYVVVAALTAVVLPVAWRRSRRSMTRYVLYTGAPLVLVLLLGFALVSVGLAAADELLARQVFTGALIGCGITQLILLRRTQALDDLRRPTS